MGFKMAKSTKNIKQCSLDLNWEKEYPRYFSYDRPSEIKALKEFLKNQLSKGQ